MSASLNVSIALVALVVSMATLTVLVLIARRQGFGGRGAVAVRVTEPLPVRQAEKPLEVRITNPEAAVVPDPSGLARATINDAKRSRQDLERVFGLALAVERELSGRPAKNNLTGAVERALQRPKRRKR